MAKKKRDATLPVTEDDVYAYVRLSREDMRGPGTTEQKLEDRKQICRNLAAQHNLPLSESRIYCEGAGISATKLDNRPQMRAVLAACRSGQCRVLISPNQNRLLRGDLHDLQDIEDTLRAGRVTLITADGVTPFDENYDVTHGLLFGVQAVVGRHNVARGVKDRQEADRVKLKRNERTRGFAPYGYRYLRPTYDEYGKLLTPKRIEVVADQYAIVCEWSRRVWHESVSSIVRDFNARKIPPPTPPGARKQGKQWYKSTLIELLKNPWYAGHLAQRYRVERGEGIVKLDLEDYVLSDCEGDWEHPLTLAQWYGLQELLKNRPNKGTPRNALLTGVVYSSCGKAMFTRSTSQYGCLCNERPEQAHVGMTSSRARLDAWARDIVNAVLTNLPEAALKPPKRAVAAPDRRKLEQEFHQARRDAAASEEELESLIRQFATLSKRFGSDVDSVIDKVRSERDAARTKMQRLQTHLAQPDSEGIQTLLRQVRSVGLDMFWNGEGETPAAPVGVQRAVIRGIIQRIDLDPVPEGRRNTRTARVALWPWAAAYDIPLPPFLLTTRTSYPPRINNQQWTRPAPE